MTTMTTTPIKDFSQHPCFNKRSSGGCGRVHLPVAPRCNISCNFCNRKYDCVNESRPGVTSAILSPAQALRYMDEVLEREPRITVAGIAGPGDPMANATETLTTMRLLKEKYPHLLFCLSSNGLGMPAHLDELAEVGVSHATVTINAVDPAIGEHIYSWVRDGKIVYRGRQAAELLLERQLASVKGLKERGLLVKINTIVLPGVNDHHIEAVAKVVSGLGADLMNLLPMKPVEGTPFAHLPEPERAVVRELRARAGIYLDMMTHCRRCRADAVGLLGCDRSGELAPELKRCSEMEIPREEARPYVAVATREGLLINLHLGEANTFQIWEHTDGGFRMVEEREAPRAGRGPKRWEELAGALKDCRAVLASAMGDTPKLLLEEYGIEPYVCSGFIEEALKAIYLGGDMSMLQARKGGVGGGCCGGKGGVGCG